MKKLFTMMIMLIAFFLWLASPSFAVIQATLTWTDGVTNESQYDVERSVGGGAYVNVQTFGANDETINPTMTYNESGLTPQVDYCLRIVVTNQFESKTYGPACSYPGVKGDPTNIQLILTDVP